MRHRGARAGRGENENDGERHDEGEGEFSGMHDWPLLIEVWEFVRGVGQDHGHGPHAEMTARRSSMLTTPLPPDGAISAGQCGCGGQEPHEPIVDNRSSMLVTPFPVTSAGQQALAVSVAVELLADPHELDTTQSYSPFPLPEVASALFT